MARKQIKRKLKRNINKLKIKNIKLISAIACLTILAVNIATYYITYSEPTSTISSQEQSLSKIERDYVVVDDRQSDYNYYIGLNYTEITNRTTLPGLGNDGTVKTVTQKYNDTNLAKVEIIYDGTDINDNTKRGYVSYVQTERQYKYYYYKYYYINNGKIKIELIDNPFSFRPDGYGFNGWVCNNSESAITQNICNYSKISYDKSTYTRYIEIDTTLIPDYNPNTEIVLYMNAFWTKAVVQEINSTTTTNVFNNFKASTMDDYNIEGSDVYVNYWELDDRKELNTAYRYFIYGGTAASDTRFTGYYCINGSPSSTMTDCTSYNNDKCRVSQGCPYYVETTEQFNPEHTYYVYNYANRKTTLTNVTGNSTYIINAGSGQYELKSMKVGTRITGNTNLNATSLYTKVTSGTPNTTYYTNTGEACGNYSNTCNYKLIQPTDQESNMSNNIGTTNYTNEDYDFYYCTIDNPSTSTSKIQDEQTYQTGDNCTTSILNSNYYYLVTRDTNIAVLKQNITWDDNSLSNFESTKPYTLSGIAFNNDTTTNPKTITNSGHPDQKIFGITLSAGYSLTPSADMVIENLNMNSSASSTDATASSYSATSIFANFHNLKIGRNVNTTNTLSSAGFYLSSRSNSTANNKFKVIIESGKYGYVRTASNNTYSNFYATLVMGSDYDKVGEFTTDTIANYNGKLKIAYNLAAVNGSGLINSDSTTPVSQMIVKSGIYGSNISTGNEADAYTYGIYTGGFHGSGGGGPNGLMTLKVEGGYIFCINGGPTVADNTNIAIGTYITGGTIANVSGGAGVSTSNGTRLVSITGGQVTNAVAGGNNGGVDSNSNPGTLKGNTLVYIGGDATIGYASKLDKLTPTSNSQLYNWYKKTWFIDDDNVGSVYGAGLGKSTTTSGDTRNTHVIINGKDVNIERNVYGGGNYGSPGRTNMYENITSQIDIIDGNIYGSVYGGSNNVGFATENYKDGSKIIINLYDGYINKSIYGGANSEGIVYGTVNINLEGGIVNNNIYGGGFGKDTYVYGTVNINSTTDSKVQAQDLYGGSAFGTVNANSQSTTPSNNYKTNITINNGEFRSIYGGGQGDENNTPYVAGNIKVLINNIGINTRNDNDTLSIYGGNDQSGTPNGTSTVTINNGTITNVFGGGNKTPLKETNVTINNGTITNVFGGSNQEGDVENSYIAINNGIITNVFGGNNLGGETKESKIDANNGTVTSIYGGGSEAATTKTRVILNGTNADSVFGGGKKAPVYNGSNISLFTGTIGSIYGGSDQEGVVTSTNIEALGGTATNIYGGGKKAPIGYTIKEDEEGYDSSYQVEFYNGSTTIQLKGSTVTNVYGGGEEAGVSSIANIELTNGNVDYIYGGSNISGNVSLTQINAKGGTTNTIYGGGYQAPTGKTNILIDGVSTIDIFGGGESADIASGTNIDIISGTITGSVYGGSNQKGTVAETTINAKGTSVAGNIYGGNNEGGTVITSNINMLGTGTTSVFGGGNKAYVATTNVNLDGSTISNLYGGGNEAGAGTTNVFLKSGESIYVFGGSNQEGNVGTTNIKTAQSTTSTVSENGFGIQFKADVKDVQEWQDTNYKSVATITVSIVNNTDKRVTNWEADFTTKDSTIYANDSSTIVTENNSNYSFSYLDRYSSYNNHIMEPHTTYSFTIILYSKYKKEDFKIDSYNILSLDQFGEELPVDGNISISNIYGGNNLGGKTTSNNIKLDFGSYTNIYGGGNEAQSESTKTNLYNVSVSNELYGGGNKASVSNNVELNVKRSNITSNIFGGGNEGTVGGNTKLYVSNTTVGSSLFAGGNGSTATVMGNTTLDIDYNTIVGESVFGGGNAAETGTQDDGNSSTQVNIAGATIGNNVYGGAFTSKVYGRTEINLGSSVTNEGLIPSDIYVGGTVYGGGEKNAQGNDMFDYSYISVTEGVNINIDGTNYDELTINGSIFGSGNSSSSAGTSTITIKDYGTFENNQYKTGISIQRASLVILDNSSMRLKGATDSANDFDSHKFSLSRIDELKLKNNSTLILDNEAHMLKKFKSCVDINGVEIKAAVTINSDNKTVTKNVNNRLYVLEGQHLNVSTNQRDDIFGEVSGMTFFGMFKGNSNSNNVSIGLYNTDYNYGEEISVADAYFFSNGSYVMGEYITNHDISVDGFYSNFVDSESETTEMTIDYIDPKRESPSYTMWTIGKEMISYNITLTASKYVTLGVDDLPLISNVKADSTFRVRGFNSSGLNPGINLVKESDVPRVAPTTTQADNNMSLVMKNGADGWITDGSTSFISDGELVTGTTQYKRESKNLTPALTFYLYHSKNLKTSGEMGYVTIVIDVLTPKDEISYDFETILITVNLNRALFAQNDYEAAITADKQYKMFSTQDVNVTTVGSLSAYYSLFYDQVDENGNASTNYESPYKSGYHRSLVSSYVFPVGTKITMIDMVTDSDPEYYYLVITQDDVDRANLELQTYKDNHVSYNFSLFTKMGSTDSNNKYDDAIKNNLYYNSRENYAQEEFIFILDFSEANIDEDIENQSLLVELRNREEKSIIGVLGTHQAWMYYNLYHGEGTIIDIDASIDRNTVYPGDRVGMNINTTLSSGITSGKTVTDTKYTGSQMGIKLSLYMDDKDNDNTNDISITGVSMIGLNFTYDGNTYYPRTDGTTRIKLASKVGNVNARIYLNGTNSLATGDYKLKIESFGSPDGVYYGLTSSDTEYLYFSILNTSYGLSVDTNKNNTIVDKDTGNTKNDNNIYNYSIRSITNLDNPNIRISLQRRNYDTIYSLNYDYIDLSNYFNINYELANKDTYEYYLIKSILNDPDINISGDEDSKEASLLKNFSMTLKDNLITGTYKLTFSMYDDDTKIGEVYKYIIIK